MKDLDWAALRAWELGGSMPRRIELAAATDRLPNAGEAEIGCEATDLSGALFAECVVFRKAEEEATGFSDSGRSAGGSGNVRFVA